MRCDRKELTSAGGLTALVLDSVEWIAQKGIMAASKKCKAKLGISTPKSPLGVMGGCNSSANSKSNFRTIAMRIVGSSGLVGAS